MAAETRPTVYPRRREANRLVRIGREWKKPNDPGGTGTEIVREVISCPSCASREPG